ncbi:MAG: FAD-binding protein [Gammaproteobacteria bacterium]|nr:FAD-binding protein [Gammaproteobacteria bacterium]
MRSYFRLKSTPEKGRHKAYLQILEGEYAFRLDSGVQPPFETYKNATKELQNIIQFCLQNNKSLRARGSLWSLSTAAVTDGRLIDTKALVLVFEVPQALVNPVYTGNAKKLRFVECGNSVAHLNDSLFADGLSIKASGSNDGQTIAGALSTGTHGSAYKFGAMQEMVVGLHLITGPNKHVYLQRHSLPVMQDGFAKSMGAEFKQDDTMFNAALVSFGSFGIIHGIMIETRSLFALNAVRFIYPYDDTLKTAISTSDPTLIPLPPEAHAVNVDQPYHFEIFLNPNEGAPPNEAIVLLMYETPYDAATYVPPQWNGGESGMGASGLNIMGAIVGNIPSPLNQLAVPFLNSQVKDEFAPYYKRAIIRDLFRGEKTPEKTKTLACGIGMSIANAIEAMDIVFNTYKNNDIVLPLILSFRFVKGTQALLGFTHFDQTAVLEIDALNTTETREFLYQIWHALDSANIPFTLHWGKFNAYLTPSRVRERFGNNVVDQWIASRHRLLDDANVRQLFNNSFMTQLGLAS